MLVHGARAATPLVQVTEPGLPAVPVRMALPALASTLVTIAMSLDGSATSNGGGGLGSVTDSDGDGGPGGGTGSDVGGSWSPGDADWLMVAGGRASDGCALSTVELAVASTDVALPRTTATEMRCDIHAVSRESPVRAVNRRPRSLTSPPAAGPKTPVVSSAKGINIYLSERAA